MTLLPTFDDSHEHLMEAGRNTMLVPVDEARSIDEFKKLSGATQPFSFTGGAQNFTVPANVRALGRPIAIT